MKETTNLPNDILDDDILTQKFINEKNYCLLIHIKEEINIKLKKIKNDKQPKFEAIDIVYRIISIYNEFHLVLFKEQKNILEDENLKLLKEYYNYLKIREKMFNNSPNLIYPREKEVIKLIELFFENIQYYDNIKKILKDYDEFILNKKTLTKKQYELFNKLLSNNCFDNIPDSYINYYMFLILNNNYNIESETLKIAILNLGKNILKAYNINCKIIFKNLKEDGIFKEDIIFINENLINQFIDSKCENITIFMTLFHEIRHAIQDKNVKSRNYSNYTVIKMIKDLLFTDFMSKKEYNINYYKLTTEFDAYNMEIIWTYRYFKSIGVKKNFLKLGEHIATSHNLLYKTDNRIVNHKLLPLDILFDIYIKDIIIYYKKRYNINIFEVYPSLQYVYNLDGTRKDTIQLLKECDNANDSEKWIYYDILNNQTLSYIEVIKLLKKINRSKYKDIILPLLKNRIKSSLRIMIDVYSFIADNLTLNTKNILNEYSKVLSKIGMKEQKKNTIRK